jgi:hypothetical protein
MKKIDLNQFYAWVEEKPERRSVEIKLGHQNIQSKYVWVYDYDLMEGAFVLSVDEIPDFEERKERHDYERFIRLQSKFVKEKAPATNKGQEEFIPLNDTIFDAVEEEKLAGIL